LGLPSLLAVHTSALVVAPDHPDGFPDASAPAEEAPLRDLRPADAIPQAQLASDASAAVHPDEAADAPILALAAVVCAEKLVVPAQVVPALDAKLHPTQALPAQPEAPCIPGAGRSAA
jgi:hypothetical protein